MKLQNHLNEESFMDFLDGNALVGSIVGVVCGLMKKEMWLARILLAY